MGFDKTEMQQAIVYSTLLCQATYGEYDPELECKMCKMTGAYPWEIERPTPNPNVKEVLTGTACLVCRANATTLISTMKERMKELVFKEKDQEQARKKAKRKAIEKARRKNR